MAKLVSYCTDALKKSVSDQRGEFSESAFVKQAVLEKLHKIESEKEKK